MKNIETEYKWAISGPADFKKLKAALQACGYPYKESSPLLLDTYFDTAENALSAEKSALRLRKVNLNNKTSYELTLKSATAIKDGVAIRRETTVNLKSRMRAGALKDFRFEAQKLKKNAVNLKRLFSIFNRRKVFLIKGPDFKAELSFDNCLIKSGIHKKLLEAELEFKGGEMSAFNKFADYLRRQTGLKAPAKSKVATARSLLKR